MRARIPLCFCAFTVMALSSAIVPVLPLIGDGAAMQGAIYAAYFIGAVIATLPAGLIADRLDPVHLIRSGAVLSAISGLLLLIATGLFWILLFRFIEGLAAGMFIASALAWINEQTDHVSLSGYFMATLNAGLICGLVVTGYLASYFDFGKAGIAVFSGMALLGCILVFMIRTGEVIPRDQTVRPAEPVYQRILQLTMEYRWLWLSAIIVTGATGVVTSLYPGFSGEIPQVTAMYISAMNIGTIVSVILASRFVLSAVPAIRTGAVITAVSVFSCYFTPWAFIFVGAAAGVVMIAQMAYLSESETRQGTLMGIYTTASYAGMSLLPFIAGLVAENSSYFMAFLFTVFAVLTVPFTIGRCTGKKRTGATSPSTGKQ
jgi:DHA1 family quinolone resistance protein-like MFS transporter